MIDQYRSRGGRDGGTLTVVTGPSGVDIGPVVAELGRGLRDGLAVRTVDSDRVDIVANTLHTSPIPAYVPAHLHAPDDGSGHSFRNGIIPGRVLLRVLPSAWQDPDTNLGVAWSGEVTVALTGDLNRLDWLGMHPGHRVTVQHRGSYRVGSAIPEPIEVGDLATHARDSVLRAGGQVLIEAGDGQTFLDALRIIGIAPWASYIEHLELWAVVDVSGLGHHGGFDPAMLTGLVGAEIQRNGGVPATGQVSLQVALTGAHVLLPGLTGLRNDADPALLDESTADSLGELLGAVERQCNTEPLLLGTGVDADGRDTFLNFFEDREDPS